MDIAENGASPPAAGSNRETPAAVPHRILARLSSRSVRI
jgi:hypothetical protein